MSRPRSGVRVIAGSAKGRRLETPAGGSTRPITDRVKESLFGMLTPHLPGARVLDLYAGSGALAIEALSRGADEAVLVERDRRACDVIRRNLEAARFADEARLECADVDGFVRRGDTGSGFSLVFCDPPYPLATAEVDAVLGALGRGRWVRPEGVVVVRRRRSDGPPGLPAGWEFARERVYGDTLLCVAAVHSQ